MNTTATAIINTEEKYDDAPSVLREWPLGAELGNRSPVQEGGDAAAEGPVVGDNVPVQFKSLFARGEQPLNFVFWLPPHVTFEELLTTVVRLYDFEVTLLVTDPDDDIIVLHNTEGLHAAIVHAGSKEQPVT